MENHTTTSIFLLTLLLLLPLSSSSFFNFTFPPWKHRYGRHRGTETAGCGCEQLPPPPPPCLPPAPPPTNEPQPSDFADSRLYVAYKVIQSFKRTITCDPRGITASWSGAGICESYQGFYCSNPPDNRSAIALAAADFNGYGLCAPTLTNFIDRLPDLAFFHANSNNFTGAVPDLSHLPFFFELDLSNNRFTGPYPSAALALRGLAFLDLRYNSFSGLVPPDVSALPVEVLFLNNNGFVGTLPPSLFSTNTTKYLTVANNAFMGPIPHVVSEAASGTLLEASLLNNRLSGCLPHEIGLLGELILLDVGSNLLTGPIPYSFGCLAKLEELNLAGNYLYGSVPEVVCQLGNLRNLSLSDNYFTALGEHCLELAKKGVLDLRKNCIPGLPDQRPHEECLGFLAGAMKCPDALRYYMPCRPQPHPQPCPSCQYSAPPCRKPADGGGGGGGERRRPKRVLEALVSDRV